jgi:hypothetical protein
LPNASTTSSTVMRSTTGSGLSEIEHMVLLPAECFVYSSSWASVEFDAHQSFLPSAL